MNDSTFREAAMKGIAEGRARKVSIVEDEAYSAFRIQVWFKHTDGEEYCYQSKPFTGIDYQDLAREAAKRVERLGVPRRFVLQWVGNNFEKAKIDPSRLFA
jgi:hypothetical protein